MGATSALGYLCPISVRPVPKDGEGSIGVPEVRPGIPPREARPPIHRPARGDSRGDSDLRASCHPARQNTDYAFSLSNLTHDFDINKYKKSLNEDRWHLFPH